MTTEDGSPTMKGRDFRAALQDADRAWRRGGVPAASDRRLRAGLAGRGPTSADGPVRSRARWGLAVAAAALVAVAGTVTSRWLGTSASGPAPLPAGVVVRAGSPDLVIAREGEAVRVVRGRAELVVARRPAGGPPARVLVSHGFIEVMGTRFTVEQEDGRGRVTLHEGAIRFSSEAGDPGAGETVVLAPGDSLEWPRRTATARTVAPPAPPSPRPETDAKPSRKTAARPAPMAETPASASPAPVEPADALLERIETLRSRGLFAQAAAELARAIDGGGYPRGARERLSYELGSLLTHQIRDRERGCAHWRAHTRAFGRARYGREIGQASEVLGCDPR